MWERLRKSSVEFIALECGKEGTMPENTFIGKSPKHPMHENVEKTVFVSTTANKNKKFMQVIQTTIRWRPDQNKHSIHCSNAVANILLCKPQQLLSTNTQFWEPVMENVISCRRIGRRMFASMYTSQAEESTAFC